MDDEQKCNGKYWWCCRRCLRLLVNDLRAIVRPSKDTDWNVMNDKEKIKKAAMFIDSFLVRTNTNLKKYTASKDLPEKESVIEILESQKMVLEKIK